MFDYRLLRSRRGYAYFRCEVHNYRAFTVLTFVMIVVITGVYYTAVLLVHRAALVSVKRQSALIYNFSRRTLR